MGTNGDSNWVNRFWLNAAYTGTPTGAQVLALSNAVSAAFRTRFLPHLSNDLHVTHQRTVLYHSSTVEIAVDGTDTGTGGETGAAMLAQTCYLINWSIAGSYRGGHPRTYLSGPSSDGVGTLTTPTSGIRTSLSTDANNFLADCNALTPTPFSTITLGTFRFFRAHSAVDPPVFEPYLAGSCAPKFATQRRRIGR